MLQKSLIAARGFGLDDYQNFRFNFDTEEAAKRHTSMILTGGEGCLPPTSSPSPSSRPPWPWRGKKVMKSSHAGVFCNGAVFLLYSGAVSGLRRCIFVHQRAQSETASPYSAFTAIGLHADPLWRRHLGEVAACKKKNHWNSPLHHKLKTGVIFALRRILSEIRPLQVLDSSSCIS